MLQTYNFDQSWNYLNVGIKLLLVAAEGDNYIYIYNHGLDFTPISKEQLKILSCNMMSNMELYSS